LHESDTKIIEKMHGIGACCVTQVSARDSVKFTNAIAQLLLTLGWTCCRPGFLKRGPRYPLGAMERFSWGHEQRHLLNSSAVILQNPTYIQ